MLDHQGGAQETGMQQNGRFRRRRRAKKAWAKDQVRKKKPDSRQDVKSPECLEMGGDKWGERDQKTTGKILPAMMWRPTWIPRPRGRPRQHTQHPLGLM